jgi:VWFA-related protein
MVNVWTGARGLATVGLLLFAGAAAVGQAPPATPAEPPLIRMNVDLVQFDVVVTDSQGRHVADLRPEEFEVFENGNPQRITNFSFIPATRSITAVERAAAPQSSVAPTPIRPDQVTRTIVVLVDDLGLGDQSFMALRPALERFVNEQVQPDDLVAIVTSSGSLGALQRLTTDKRVLRAAVARLRSLPNHRLGVNEEDFHGACPAAPGDRTDYYTRLSIAALRRIVDGLRELPGRRSILLFSEGIAVVCLPLQDSSRHSAPRFGPLEALLPVSDVAATAEYNALLLHASRSGVRINTVDPRGLIANFDTAERQKRPGDLGPQQRQQAFIETQAMLAALAHDTGGIAVANDNDLSAAVERVLHEEAGYYLIGYKPSPRAAPSLAEGAKGAPRVRRLSVRVSRPGLRANFHSTLYAATPTAPQSAAGRVAAAVLSPFVHSEIRIRFASRFWDAGAEGGPLLDTVMHIDARDLAFSAGSGGRHTAVFDITAVIFGAQPKPLDTFEKSYTVSLADSAYRQALGSGLVQRLELSLKQPGAYQLRGAVHDRQSDRIGSSSEFVEVPNLKSGEFALSGIMLSLGDSRVGAPEAPRVTNFHPGETVIYACQILNARPGQTGALKVQVRTELSQNGKVLGSGAPLPLNTQNQSDPKRPVVTGDFRLGKQLAPGEYTLRLTATDLNAPARRNTATQSVDFEVVEPRP